MFTTQKLSLNQINKELADPAIIDAINRYAAAIGSTNTAISARISLLKAAALPDLPSTQFFSNADAKNGPGLPAPEAVKAISIPAPPVAPWETFWGSIQLGLSRIKSGLPSVKQSLSDTLINLPNRAADIFTNSIAKFDGTLKGFFKSVAVGFAQMVKEILIEQLKLQIIKGITKLIGAAAGGSFGGASGGGSASHEFGNSFGGFGGARAGGGDVTAGKSYLINENEREYFVPSTTGKVFNSAQLAEMGGGKSSLNQTNNFNFYAEKQTGAFDRQSAQQAAKAAAAQLESEKRRA